jgi:GntR family transcriptional regulator
LLNAHGPLRHSLQGWLADARSAGLDDESIEALFKECFRSTSLAGLA